MQPVPIPHTSRPPSAVFHLAQPWRDQPEPGFLPATVHLAWEPAALIIRAALRDIHIFTDATADNQRMWELGDVFEIFLMVEGRPDYTEFHVTPNNRRMHLHLPGAAGRPSPDADPLPFEAMLRPVGFTSETTISQAGWEVVARIPAESLHLDAFRSGDALRASFCRYDASPGKKPVLSSTSAHPAPDFHRPDEWAPIRLAPEGRSTI